MRHIQGFFATMVAASALTLAGAIAAAQSPMPKPAAAAPARASQATAPTELPRYLLDATLDPTAHTLDTRATMEFPAAMAGQSIEFLLAAPLQVIESEPAVERLEADAGKGFMGINGSSVGVTKSGRAARYRVQLPAGGRRVVLHYKGRVDFGFETPGQEYARGFNETAGVIREDGVYLAGSTLWYPYLGETLFTFELSARSPEGWQLISPGNGTARDAQGVAHWRSDTPLDELHIVGGPLTRYARAAGAVTAEVYLRKPDEALAAKYLEATARNLEMYRGLIGTYPYDKFALVENFWETGYGMPSFTLLGPQIIRFPFILTSSYPHEILHNWWGNGVFVDYARGNWCEGLTAYLADHLYKEQQGQGAEYRRDTLKKYRDFVKEGRDFPLTEFRSRHSPATEAVGYGKALMTFHMARRQLATRPHPRAALLSRASAASGRASTISPGPRAPPHRPTSRRCSTSGSRAVARPICGSPRSGWKRVARTPWHGTAAPGGRRRAVQARRAGRRPYGARHADGQRADGRARCPFRDSGEGRAAGARSRPRVRSVSPA